MPWTVKRLPSRFAAWFRRNQLMILITGSFIMLLFLTGTFALAILSNNEVQERRRQESREQILCILDKTTSPKCDQSKLDITGLSEQNKKLTEDNIFLADRNIFYQKCLGRIFVVYTQQLKPIRLDDLTKCEFTVKDAASYQSDFNPTLNDSRNMSAPTKPEESKPAPEPQPIEQPVAQRCTIDTWIVKLLCD